MSLPQAGDRVAYFPGVGEEGEGQGPFPAIVQHALPMGQLHLLVHLQVDDQDAKEVEKTCIQFLDVGPVNRVGAYCCSVLIVDEPADDIPPEQPEPEQPEPDSLPVDGDKLPTNPPSDPPPSSPTTTDALPAETPPQ